MGSFIIFVISIFVLLAITIMAITFKAIKKDFFLFKDKVYKYFILILSIIVIFIVYCFNDFKTIYTQPNEWLINISLLSHLFIYSFIFSIFIILFLFIPYRTYIAIKAYKNDKQLLINNIKLFLIFGTLLVILSSIAYAFKQPIIPLNGQFENINAFINNSLYSSYQTLDKLINSTLKSNWFSWVLISYTILWLLINFIMCKYAKQNLKQSFIDKINYLLGYFKFLYLFMAFIAIISTFILSWQSFFLRILIMCLVMFIFSLINYGFSLIIKPKTNNVNHNNVIDFMNNVIVGMLFIFYLMISSKKVLTWPNPGEHVNFWFSFYISSMLLSIIYINNSNSSLMRTNLTFNIISISSGINTIPLYFVMDGFDLFCKINSKILVKYVKLN